MAITIAIAPDLEAKLKGLTNRKGMNLEELVNNLLQKQLEQITSTEDELLKKINLGISSKKWRTYYQLVEKRKAETLTNVEHQQLIGITNEIELANAKRMKYLVELAQLRGVKPKDLMHDLGIKPNNHV